MNTEKQTYTPVQKTVLTHLQENKWKGLTQLEALGVYGIYRLAPRILELKNKGHKIETVLKTDKRKTRYARYYLND